MGKIEAAIYGWMEAHPTAWSIIDGVVFWTAVVCVALGLLYWVATSLILVWEHHREKALPWMVKHGVFENEEASDDKAEDKQNDEA